MSSAAIATLELPAQFDAPADLQDEILGLLEVHNVPQHWRDQIMKLVAFAECEAQL
jgi:hypothetical protein